MENTFGLVLFSYVGDCYWVAPSYEGLELPGAQWLAQVFEYIVASLLGWKLDPDKSKVGSAITLLGLEIDGARVVPLARKAQYWINDMREILEANWLTPAAASTLCGKLGFLISHIVLSAR